MYSRLSMSPGIYLCVGDILVSSVNGFALDGVGVAESGGCAVDRSLTGSRSRPLICSIIVGAGGEVHY
jgi:hypothetical protein